VAIEIRPAEPPAPKQSPLAALHAALGARMGPFAGWMLPIQYASILAEHAACRASAALFDVSHMGQIAFSGAAAALERIVVGDIAGLRPGRQRYTLLTNEAGGIVDDLMVGHLGERLHLVVNAARIEHDLRHLALHLPPGAAIAHERERALLALQGPAAVTVLARMAPQAAAMRFMDVAELALAGTACIVARSGYTGEDGFEISLPVRDAERIARLLLENPEVTPAGLGARDLLRLEAGLPLYGLDLDDVTTPVEAGLAWTIGKRRRAAWDFLGAAAIRDQIDNGAPRLRVGLHLEGRAPARGGASLLGPDGTEAGTVTSGTFSPTLGRPIAMAYVRRDLAADGTKLSALLRGRPVGARVVPLPFVPHHYPR
jgi:aminomethyltransferase